MQPDVLIFNYIRDLCNVLLKMVFVRNVVRWYMDARKFLFIASFKNIMGFFVLFALDISYLLERATILLRGKCSSKSSMSSTSPLTLTANEAVKCKIADKIVNSRQCRILYFHIEVEHESHTQLGRVMFSRAYGQAFHFHDGARKLFDIGQELA